MKGGGQPRWNSLGYRLLGGGSRRGSCWGERGRRKKVSWLVREAKSGRNATEKIVNKKRWFCSALEKCGK